MYIYHSSLQLMVAFVICVTGPWSLFLHTPPRRPPPTSSPCWEYSTDEPRRAAPKGQPLEESPHSPITGTLGEILGVVFFHRGPQELHVKQVYVRGGAVDIEHARVFVKDS